MSISKSLGRSIPYKIVGGPRHGELLWLSPAVLALPDCTVIHVPEIVRDQDGKEWVRRLIGYSPETDTRRAIYQVEARGQ